VRCVPEQALSEQWEKYRPQSVSEEERKKALSDMAKKVKGKVVELGTNHKTSRLIQAILKQGTTAEKDLIWKEVCITAPHPLFPVRLRSCALSAKLMESDAAAVRKSKQLKTRDGGVCQARILTSLV
jgi:hypothetical protein